MNAHSETHGPQEQLDLIVNARTPVLGYLWSRDYAFAIKLLAGGSLLGLVSYNMYGEGRTIDDPCMIRRVGYREGYSVGVRGISYFDARNDEEFVELCKRYNVRFILPGNAFRRLEK